MVKTIIYRYYGELELPHKDFSYLRSTVVIGRNSCIQFSDYEGNSNASCSSRIIKVQKRN